MRERRVVVTGLGIISSLGEGATAFTAGLRTGRSGISPIQSFDTTGFDYAMGGEVHEFVPHHWLQRLAPAHWGRTSQMAAAAARMALEDAHQPVDDLDPSRCGTIMGTTDGEARVMDTLAAQWVRDGPHTLSPDLVRQLPAHRLAVAVAQELNLQGEASVVLTACAAGNYAIGRAFDLIQMGEADVMLCGGADSVCRKTFAGFYRLGAIAPEVCQPFDLNRRGIVTGEGAAVLFLETLERAQSRNARIYAEVLGYGLSCDATHMTSPNRESIARCIRRAQRNAGIRPDQVDYISVHGTGTKLNDVVEVAACRDVMGTHLPPMSSIKSMLGHTMGAASAFGAAACALGLYHQFMPPTTNFETVDPECAVDCVPNLARVATLHIVENHGFGFGGNNAVLLMGDPAWINHHLC